MADDYDPPKGLPILRHRSIDGTRELGERFGVNW
jgi:hypothetical protein